MKFIDFKEKNRIFKAEGCNDLPAYNDGQQTIVKCQFTPQEVQAMIEGDGSCYISILAGDSIPPIAVMVQSPFFDVKHAEAYCEVEYFAMVETPGKKNTIIVYNGIDAPAPKMLEINGKKYLKNVMGKPRRTMNPIFKNGDHYIRATNPQEKEGLGEDVALVCVEVGGALEGLRRIPKE